QLRCLSTNDLGIAAAPAIVDEDVSPVAPAQLLELFREHCSPCQGCGLVGDAGEGAKAPHSLALLRSRRHRPRRRAAEQCDELAPFHSITSSARASRIGGTSSPSILAVLRLMNNSNLLTCCTGRLAGFSPLSILPV